MTAVVQRRGRQWNSNEVDVHIVNGKAQLWAAQTFLDLIEDENEFTNLDLTVQLVQALAKFNVAGQADVMSALYIERCQCAGCQGAPDTVRVNITRSDYDELQRIAKEDDVDIEDELHAAVLYITGQEGP